MKIILSFLILNFLFSGIANTKAQPAEMVLIPEGNYIPMYSEDKSVVKVESFYMDTYPVTNQQFLNFVRTHPEWDKTGVKKLFADGKYLAHWSGNSQFEKQLAQSPVVNISWFAAQKFCECEGKRLPATAEWELVAEAGTSRPDGQNEPGFNQWILDMASKPTPQVTPHIGSTRVNFYGVWDMHGLIWEWTYDFNSALTTGESRGNSSLDNSLFCGGGSFAAKDVNNYASFLRFAMRSSLKAKYAVHNVGFRCAKDK